MPGNYPAILNYLKLLLANVTELTEAVDADLANPQFMADLAAYGDGERDELPPGRTLAVLDRLDCETAGGQLKELAAMAALECRRGPNELRIRSDGILFALHGALNSAWWGCRQMLRDTLTKGKLSTIRDAVAYWSMIRYCDVIEDLAGPLRTNRRPRKATQTEAESMLLWLLRSYGETWRWDTHNDSVKTLREWKANRAKYRDDMTRAQLDAWQREGVLIDGQEASHRVAKLEELAIPELLREVCPELIQCLPPTLPLYETIDAAERAIAYQTLEGLTRAELKKHREVADPPNAGNPATVATVEPLAKSEVKGATTPNEAEPVFIFRPDGNGFYLQGFGERGHFKQLKGLADLFLLVQSPGVGVSMLKLVAGAGATRAAGDGQSRQPIIEAAELSRLNIDLRRYRNEVEEAETDYERADSQEKLDKCNEAIRAMTGLNGKPRDLNNPNDRLRARVDGRIKTACRAIENTCPSLARHFFDTCGAEGPLYIYTPGIARFKWDTSEKQ